MKTSPATQARERANISVEDAARHARITPKHLRVIELHGGAGYTTAQKLARLYGCKMELLLIPRSQKSANKRSGRKPRRRTRAGIGTPLAVHSCT